MNISPVSLNNYNYPQKQNKEVSFQRKLPKLFGLGKNPFRKLSEPRLNSILASFRRDIQDCKKALDMMPMRKPEDLPPYLRMLQALEDYEKSAKGIEAELARRSA